MEEEEQIRLITKHLSRETSPDEEACLQEWLAADLAHRQEFEALRHAWDTGAEVILEQSFDKQLAWEKIQAPRTPVRRTVYRWWTAAAVVLALCIGSGWYFLARPHLYREVVAAMDSQQLALPDGSKVWLRKGSGLRYSAGFGKTGRNVRLNGEAFFEPSRDPTRPFVITTSHCTIQDIGTTFVVRGGDSIDEVLVIEGKVRLTAMDNPARPLILSSGQQATISNNKLSPSDWGSLNMMSWKTGVLEFRQTPLDQTVQDINDLFGSKLAIAPDLQPEAGRLKITARFDHQPFEQTVDEIKLATGLHIMRIKDTLFFVRQ